MDYVFDCESNGVMQRNVNDFDSLFSSEIISLWLNTGFLLCINSLYFTLSDLYRKGNGMIGYRKLKYCDFFFSN